MKIAVIGLGSMGKRRIRLLKEIVPECEIIGIDSKKERIQEVTKEYQIKGYQSLTEVTSSLDCVFVCTSPAYHGKIIEEALLLNCHVFTEINLIQDRYESNMQLAKEKGKVLFLSSTTLYKSEMQYLAERIKKERKPSVYHYHVGQYLPDWHPWDNLKDFFVSDKTTNGCRELLAIELPWIQHVFGKILNVHVIKRKLTDLELDFPDTYMIQVEHEGGNIGSILIDVVSREAVRKLEVVNEDLYIKWDGTPETLFQKDIEDGELKLVPTGKYIHEQGYGSFINEYAYMKEIEEFFAAIKGKKAIYGFAEDLEMINIMDKIES